MDTKPNSLKKKNVNPLSVLTKTVCRIIRAQKPSKPRRKRINPFAGKTPEVRKFSNISSLNTEKETLGGAEKRTRVGSDDQSLQIYEDAALLLSLSSKIPYCPKTKKMEDDAKMLFTKQTAEILVRISRKPPKKVNFALGTKPNDGLCLSSEIFQEYINDIFKINRPPEKKTVVQKYANSLNIPAIETLKAMLQDLIDRCAEDGSAFILPCGGGNLKRVHAVRIPYMRTHIVYLDEVISTIRGLIEQRQLQTLSS
jgi:hypothetical protein